MLFPYLLLVVIYAFILAIRGIGAGLGTPTLVFGFILLAIPAVFYESGLAGRPLANRHPVFAGVLTIVCAALMLLSDISSLAVSVIAIVAGARMIASS
jgi:hypothetical protein